LLLVGVGTNTGSFVDHVNIEKFVLLSAGAWGPSPIASPT